MTKASINTVVRNGNKRWEKREDDYIIQNVKIVNTKGKKGYNSRQLAFDLGRSKDAVHVRIVHLRSIGRPIPSLKPTTQSKETSNTLDVNKKVHFIRIEKVLDLIDHIRILESHGLKVSLS